MNNLTTERISELVTDALERTAFVLVDIIDEEDADGLTSPNCFVKVAFSGAAEGQVVLAASKGFTIELASSILGVDAGEIDAEKDGADALSELANIVGGSIILEMGGQEQYIKYGLPTPLRADDVPAESDRSVKCYLECDGEILSVSWYPAVARSAAA